MADRFKARMGSLEPCLFAEVGPAAAARGFYEPDEPAEVARWKTPRSKTRIATNSDDDVRDITRLAFAGPERLAHRVLTLLDGVRVHACDSAPGGCLPEEAHDPRLPLH